MYLPFKAVLRRVLSYSKYNPLLPFNYLNLHRAFCNEFIRGSYVFLTVVREESPVFCFCSFFLSDFGVSWSFSETPSTSNTFGEKKEKNYCLFFEKQSGYSLLFHPCPSFFFARLNYREFPLKYAKHRRFDSVTIMRL